MVLSAVAFRRDETPLLYRQSITRNTEVPGRNRLIGNEPGDVRISVSTGRKDGNQQKNVGRTEKQYERNDPSYLGEIPALPASSSSSSPVAPSQEGECLNLSQSIAYSVVQ